MLNELNWKILKCLLKAKKPVSNKELSLHCNVAINTIRKEIGLINEEVEKHGFTIVSKTSVGNYLKIVNHKLAEPYIERLYYLYKRNQRMSNQYPSHIHYLVRRCLCSNGGLTAEGLCQELYCSQGAVLRDLNTVKKILEAHGLTLKSRRGLTVEGDEWNIRQCLIHQHKIFKNSIEEPHYRESAFKSMFFMLGGVDYYSSAREALMEGLAQQHDFSLPILYFPKIVHYMQLSMSRHKYTEQMHFTEEQIQRARHTAEYGFARKMYDGLKQRHYKNVPERDILALAMLLLSFESQNHHLKSLAEYEEFYQETHELIARLSGQWGYPAELFEETFVEEWICFLYTLKNRLIFNVYSDGEASGYVRCQGIRSSDLCICFARFYKEKHGIVLDRENTISAFYLFHQHLKKDSSFYYAQNILVISQYGISCAKSLALSIRQGYGSEVKSVVPAELGEYVEDEPMDFDLLMTDLNTDRRNYLASYKLPVLMVDFLPFQYRCPELDTYLKKVQKHCEWTIIKHDCFQYTNLHSRNEVIDFLADICSQYGVERGCFISHIMENDTYVESEREHGIVLLPVIMPEIQQQHLHVLINEKSFLWNENRAQIFVCYNRINSLQANQMLNGVLSKFVHITPEGVYDLIQGMDPLGVLYNH